MMEQLQFGSKTIYYELAFSERKSLGITVKPDLSVSVMAPFDSSYEKIMEKVRKKAPWIIKQQSYFLNFHPKTPKRRFISGETHLYLGKQYRIKIENSDFESVKLKGKFLNVLTNDRTKTEILVKEWYQKKARSKFHEIAEPLIENFKRYKVEPSNIVLREMATRWGSCTPGGKIILNPELIKAPRGCIEYVILHELCHLIHRDHTRKFLDLQTKEMPKWEKWKTKLELLLS